MRNTITTNLRPFPVLVPYWWTFNLTLYFTCQIWSLPIQQQIKIWCQKYRQLGIQLSDWVENVVEKEEIARYEQFLLVPQCFQKLSVVDESKWVSVEWRVKSSIVSFMFQTKIVFRLDTWNRVFGFQNNNTALWSFWFPNKTLQHCEGFCFQI